MKTVEECEAKAKEDMKKWKEFPMCCPLMNGSECLMKHCPAFLKSHWWKSSTLSTSFNYQPPGCDFLEKE